MLISVSSRPSRAARPRRAARLLAATALGLAVLSGCTSENVDCGLDACTVTLDKSVDASASVLGVEAKFVSANDNTVTLEVAGEQLQLTTGQAAAEVAGLQVALDSVNADTVTFKVSK